MGEGKGLEIPVDCKFYGNYLYLKKFRRELKAAVKGINCCGRMATIFFQSLIKMKLTVILL